MATQRILTYLDGTVIQYGTEDAALIDFGSATGNPFEIKVGGGTYFTFERDGSLRIEEDLVWNVDAGGDVGTQYDYRPDTINASNQIAVGAVSGIGDGTRLVLNRVVLGHGNVDKYVDADQGAGSGLPGTPAVRYNATHQRWEATDDGVVYFTLSGAPGSDPDAIHDNAAAEISAISEKAVPVVGDWLLIEDSADSDSKKKVQIGNLPGSSSGTWQDAYANSAPTQALDISGNPLAWSQSAVTGHGIDLTRNVATSDAALMKIETVHTSDAEAALELAHAGVGNALHVSSGAVTLDYTSPAVTGATSVEYNHHAINWGSGGIYPDTPDFAILTGLRLKYTQNALDGTSTGTAVAVGAWIDNFAITAPVGNWQTVGLVVGDLLTQASNYDVGMQVYGGDNWCWQTKTPAKSETAAFSGIANTDGNALVSGRKYSGVKGLAKPAGDAAAGGPESGTYAGVRSDLDTSNLPTSADLIAFWTEATDWDYSLYASSGQLYQEAQVGQTVPMVNLNNGTAAQPFIDFDGIETADKLATVSTNFGVSGIVVGPNNDVWSNHKMVRVEVNGSVGWICLYT